MIIKTIKNDFNPHSREGSDGNYVKVSDYAAISIHIPAKGVTYDGADRGRYIGISIHTPAKGVTLTQ